MQRTKKLMACVLAAAMVVGLLPSAALADEPDDTQNTIDVTIDNQVEVESDLQIVFDEEPKGETVLEVSEIGEEEEGEPSDEEEPPKENVETLSEDSQSLPANEESSASDPSTEGSTNDSNALAGEQTEGDNSSDMTESQESKAAEEPEAQEDPANSYLESSSVQEPEASEELKPSEEGSAAEESSNVEESSTEIISEEGSEEAKQARIETEKVDPSDSEKNDDSASKESENPNQDETSAKETEDNTKEESNDSEAKENTDKVAEEEKEEDDSADEAERAAILGSPLLNGLNFASKRLIVAGNSGIFEADDPILDSYAGLFLLQFETEEDAKIAYVRLYGKADFIEVDSPVSLADGSYSGSTDEMSEENNPFSELKSLGGGSGYYDVAVIGAGNKNGFVAELIASVALGFAALV